MADRVEQIANGFKLYQKKGFGGVRVYSKNGVLMTAFLLSNDAYLAIPVTPNITLQSPQFDFVKKPELITQYESELRNIAERFNITFSGN